MSTAALKAEPGLLAAGPDALLQGAADAVAAADRVLQAAKTGVRAKVAEAGGIDEAQHAGHGLAWLATTVEGLRQMHAWGSRLLQEGRFGEFEQLILVASFAEYLAQIAGGIPMSQVEIIRADALGVPRMEVRRFEDEVAALVAAGSDQDVKSRLAELIADAARCHHLRRYRPRRYASPRSTSRCASSRRPRSCRTRTSGT